MNAADRWTEARTSFTLKKTWEASQRVVVRLSDNVRWPPQCFLSAAIEALRSNTHEPVNILVDPGGREAAVSLLSNHSNLATVKIVLLGDANGSTLPQDVHDKLLQQHMLNASRAFWVDGHSQLPTKRRKPYELIWTWCPPLRSSAHGDCDEFLPATMADFEVQARPRVAHDERPATPASSTAATPGARSCSRQIFIRSRWSRQSAWVEWEPPSPGTLRRRSDLQHGEWVLDDACIAYTPNPSYTTVLKSSTPWFAVDRFALLAQGHAASQQVLYPLPWPDIYAEYDPGYTRLDSERTGHVLPAWTSPRFGGARAPRADCIWHNETTTFLGEMSMDNLFHSFIHAIPTREYYARVQHSRGAKSPELLRLPHYLMYWPSLADSKASSAGGEPRAVPYVGWQILARSLGVGAAEWLAASLRMRQLSNSTACNCYRRVHGGHTSFMPPPFSPVREAVARVGAFRNAIAATVSPPIRRQQRILFQLRHSGARHIVNELEFRSAIEADPVLGQRVHFAVMEDLPVMEQYALIQSSTSLAGVHGMGLAWTMLLPADSLGASSCLEITGMWPSFHRHDYYMLSKANDVYYLRIQQLASPECICYGCHYRMCGNITANATEVAPVLRWMVQRFAGGVAVPPLEDKRAPPPKCHGIKGTRSCPDYLWPNAVPLSL